MSTIALGPALPIKLHSHVMIGHGQEYLIVVGGMGAERSIEDGEPYIGVDEQNLQTAMYKLTCSSGILKWTIMNQEMNLARAAHVAIPLKDSMVSCN